MKKYVILFLSLLLLLSSSIIASIPSASALEPQRGSRLDTLRYKVVQSPQAQFTEMVHGPPTGSDVWTSGVKQVWPIEVEEAISLGAIDLDRVYALHHQGLTISSRWSFLYSRIVINLRKPPLDDVNFRHALAHLLPKDRLIGTLFKDAVVKTDTPVPPAQGPWYNGDVDPHLYSPEEAFMILAQAILPDGSPKYKYEQVDAVWKYASGAPLETIRFYTPPAVVAPTAFACAKVFVQECQTIGLMNVVQAPADFATYVNQYTYTQKNFELAWICHDLGRFGTHLWSQYSPINYAPPGKYSPNPHGNIDPALEAVLDTLYKNFDLQKRIEAAQTAQEMLMGGTTTDPLPHGIDTTHHPRNQSIVAIPVYSSNSYAAQQPDLRGAVNMFGYGIGNIWTYLNLYWDTPSNTRPGTNEKTAVIILHDYPEKLSPLYANTAYAWTLMGPVYDNLLAINPYTLRDIDWLAQPTWHYEKANGGMDVTFDIKLTDSEGQAIKWQDGKPISINDIKFSWDFLKDREIPLFWSAFRYYDKDTTVIMDQDTIRAHMTKPSPWLLYDLAGAAFMLPPQVWTRDPRDGYWTDLRDILEFDPSDLIYPTGFNVDPGPVSLPTQLFGTGPFVLQDSTNDIKNTGYGELRANRNPWGAGYFMTTTGVQDLIEYTFWRAGDVVDDDKIDGADLGAVGEAFDAVPGDPNWNVMADITGPAGTPPDEYIGIDDLATVGKYFGETETVPYGKATPP